MIAKEEYNYKIDIWALGILLYELTHQDAPFVGNNVEEIQAAIARGTYELKPTLSKDLKDLITLILDFDPDKRPTTAEIMKHPWMTQPQDEPMKHRARDQSKDKLVLGEIRGEDRSRAREELQRMRKEEYQRRNHRMDSRDDKFSSSKDGGLRMINNRKNSMADYEHFQDYKPNRPGSKKLRALDNDKLVCVMRNSNSNGYEESMEKENAYQLKPRKITSMLPSPKNTRIEAYRPIKLGDDRIQEYLGGRKGSKRKLH